MAAESSGQGELAELVSHHILGDEDGHVSATIMYTNGQAHHLW
jgi:hypothetical protein